MIPDQGKIVFQLADSGKILHKNLNNFPDTATKSFSGKFTSCGRAITWFRNLHQQILFMFVFSCTVFHLPVQFLSDAKSNNSKITFCNKPRIIL